MGLCEAIIKARSQANLVAGSGTSAEFHFKNFIFMPIPTPSDGNQIPRVLFDSTFDSTDFLRFSKFFFIVDFFLKNVS